MLFYLLACATEHAIIDTDNDNSPVIELSCPQAEISLSCPEVVIPDIVCPEPVVRDIVIETSCPDVYIDQPDVNVTVDGPDMTGIEAAIDDMTITIDNTLNNISSQPGSLDLWAHIGTHSSPNTNIWMNNTPNTAIITTAGASGGCSVYNASGVMEINDFCDGQMCITSGWSPGTNGVLSISVEPGGWVDCYRPTSARFYLGGYYQ